MSRDLLRFLAEQTGETLWAIDESRLSLSEREAPPAGAGIAMIPLQGALTPRSVSYYGRLISPGMDMFRAQVAQAAGDPNVGAIVLDVNSPGGTYAGTPETANAVRAAAAVKPVIAVADTLAASAAYFIACQATEFVVTPSGDVGSIGVIAMHMDMSKMLEDFGVKATIIRSRPGKADANPYEPLTEGARAAIEASVAEADAEFLKAVAKGRNVSVATVRDTFGEGRTVSARQAVSLGMADRVATMSDVLSGMIKPRAASSARRRSALIFS